ncbi:hypothetical protein MKW94_015938 [Papaver nudicaule]|uniref:Uncharacterized protein n=1 Tax=Papaver nudicaule TaxID=74823 RepID=A0AA41V3G0_PAPNU|nr:hypothetical protein [Papaver nudicaule]
MRLFTNTTRVYMFSKNIVGDINSFHVCKPHMKLDICICLVESMLSSPHTDEQWMREMKQLSLALSTSDENPDIQYSRIGDCFKKLAARTPKVKKLLLNGLLQMIINNTPVFPKIKSKEKQKSKKQAGKNSKK